MSVPPPNCPSCGAPFDVAVSGATPAVCPKCAQPIAVPPPLDRGGGASPLDLDHGQALGMEDGSDTGLAETFARFKNLNFAALVPWRRMIDGQFFRKRAVRLVLIFGLLPLVFYQAAVRFQLSFEEITWMIEVYFCFFWAWYFHSLIQPERAMWRQAVGYALFTVVVGIPVLLACQKLPVVRTLYSDTSSGSMAARLAGNIFGVGLLEETCKALPLLVFGLRRGTITSLRDGVFLGLMSGFGFAASEGVIYTEGATAKMLVNPSVGGASAQLLTLLDRVMSGPLQHGGWAGVVGWFIAVAARKDGPGWPLIVVGIVFMAVLHGIFDTFVSNPFGLVVAALGYVALMAYLFHDVNTADLTRKPAKPG